MNEENRDSCHGSPLPEDQEERFIRLLQKLDSRGVAFVAEFLPFCIARLNAGDTTREQVMTAWDKRQALRKDGGQE